MRGARVTCTRVKVLGVGCMCYLYMCEGAGSGVQGCEGAGCGAHVCTCTRVKVLGVGRMCVKVPVHV